MTVAPRSAARSHSARPGSPSTATFSTPATLPRPRALTASARSASAASRSAATIVCVLLLVDHPAGESRGAVQQRAVDWLDDRNHQGVIGRGEQTEPGGQRRRGQLGAVGAQHRDSLHGAICRVAEGLDHVRAGRDEITVRRPSSSIAFRCSPAVHSGATRAVAWGDGQRRAARRLPRPPRHRRRRRRRSSPRTAATSSTSSSTPTTPTARSSSGSSSSSTASTSARDEIAPAFAP